MLTMKSLNSHNHWHVSVTLRSGLGKKECQLEQTWAPRLVNSSKSSVYFDSLSEFALDCIKKILTTEAFSPGPTKIYCKHAVSFPDSIKVEDYHLQRLEILHLTNTGYFRNSTFTETNIIEACSQTLKELAFTNSYPDKTANTWVQLVSNSHFTLPNLKTLEIFNTNNMFFLEPVFKRFCDRMPQLERIRVLISGHMYDERMAWSQIRMMLKFIPTIRSVSLKFCTLQSIRILEFCKTVTHLDLTLTSFGRFCSNRTLKDCFRHLQHIQELICQSCELTPTHIKSIIHALPKGNVLKLDFSSNYNQTTKREEYKIFTDVMLNSVTKFPNAQTINLSCIVNGLTDSYLTHVMQELSRCKKNLTSRLLDISENKISSFQAQSVLSSNPPPKFLTIRLEPNYKALYGWS